MEGVSIVDMVKLVEWVPMSMALMTDILSFMRGNLLDKEVISLSLLVCLFTCTFCSCVLVCVCACIYLHEGTSMSYCDSDIDADFAVSRYGLLAGGRRGSFRGGHHAPGRAVAVGGPSRPNPTRLWHDGPDRGYGGHLSYRRQPFPQGENFDRPFIGRQVDDPYFYNDRARGVKRPFYAMVSYIFAQLFSFSFPFYFLVKL